MKKEEYICLECASSILSKYNPIFCLICQCNGHRYKLINKIAYEAKLGNKEYSFKEIEDKIYEKKKSDQKKDTKD